jgi:SAM-dependent methyltransferase
MSGPHPPADAATKSSGHDADHAIADALRAGLRVKDQAFDSVYPENVRRVSARYWTPVYMAMTASRWLADLGARSVLDVGSGPGKFCIIANLTRGLRVTGLEQRASLIEISSAAAAQYGAEVTFNLGTLESIDPTGFDAFYLFNPFGENLYHPDDYFDREPELSALRYLNDLSIFEHWLDQAAQHTCFVTYHGFGGRIPSSYALRHTLAQGPDILRLWRKEQPGLADAHYMEDEAVRRSATQSRSA